ncbi:GNAT family N-acetyltransferase [Salipaludibacillus sp. LMS25]|jgi:predicted GNAT family N-acyltransferase|uniref:GNAT family N-acetyltransferase n=1 Tax=Salipaludibacillus sp. LMS25 TaxID=2924031 RepID=UPI0020D049AB|nr:GNAT family N-acetyltransferase [Salipaludibacillus sp. LMS25]UTR13154.1 GNAT family N-acetyltransferase [Salipaludibacillus sp. LMS25]
MEIIHVNSQSELEQAFAIRQAVFVEEQGVPREDEFDEHEKLAKHLLICKEGKAVGTGRVRFIEQKAKLERICILVTYRKLGIGALIIKELETIALKQGYTHFVLHAQTQAKAFYEKLGYSPCSQVFTEEGIPHIMMERKVI